MPLRGDNPGLLNNKKRIVKDHELLIRFNTKQKSFLSHFITPVVLGLDDVLKKDNFFSISMTGISGGGWTTVLTSAIDKRINYSFPVSVSLPLSLRTDDYGDIENFYFPFYKEYPYLDLYLLASTGKKRKHMQINILNDPLSYSGRRSELYKDYLSRLSKSLKGHFLAKIINFDKHLYNYQIHNLIYKNIEKWDDL